jgi:hypothetical protein
MQIDEAVDILRQHGFLVGCSRDGYWHYCNHEIESNYATDTSVMDLARNLIRNRGVESLVGIKPQE